MTDLFRFPNATRRHPAVDAWLAARDDALGTLAREWFEVMRACGDDVRELLHDGHPTACVGEAAFAYVDAFTAHVNVGFYQGANLTDPTGLLQGAGKHMRHGKLRPDAPVERAALAALVRAGYRDVGERAAQGEPGPA